MKRVQKLRANGVDLMQCENLFARIVSRPFVVELVGLSYGPAVKHIGARESVLCGKRMVDFSCKVVFGCNGLPREGEYARVSRSSHARREWAEQGSVW